MKNLFRGAAFGGLLSTLTGLCLTASAQGTAFTYQGWLQNGGGPASGSYDLTFTLYTTNHTGAAIAGPVTNSATAVTNGLFTTLVDFGPGVFTGTNDWLEIAVRTNATGGFTTLAPRQPVTPTPYALFSATAGSAATATSAGSVAAADIIGSLGVAQLPPVVVTNNGSGVILSGVFNGNGGGLTNLFAWQLAGNMGATNGNFLGTADNQPLEFRVGGVRAGWISPSNGSPNIVFGPAQNIISNTTAGASILGGLNINIGPGSSYSLIGGGLQNSISNNAGYSVVVGGQGNSIQAGDDHSFLGGGQQNTISNSASDSVLGGGYQNNIGAAANETVLGGGYQNHLLSQQAFLGGGINNTIQAGSPAAFLGSGANLSIGSGDFESVIVGGQNNSLAANADHAFIGGGGGNAIPGGGEYDVIVGGNANTMNTFYAFLGGGYGNSIVNGQYGTLGGGYQNLIQNPNYAFLGGGYQNTNSANYAFVGGGQFNLVGAGGNWAALGGGYLNNATGNYATVPGGSNNVAGGPYSFAAGSGAQATNSGAFVWADAEGTNFGSTTANQFNVRADGGVRFVTGGAGLTVDGLPVQAGNNGGGLTNLNASQLAGGTVPLAQLPSAVVTNNEPLVALGGLSLGSLTLPDPTIISVNETIIIPPFHNNVPLLISGSANNNLFLGLGAGGVATNGADNTGIGNSVLWQNTSGKDNTGEGFYSLFGNTTGSNNVAMGATALSENISGNDNTALGAAALENTTNDSYLVAIGYEALQNDNAAGGILGSGANTAVGFQALQQNTTGTANTAVGFQTLNGNVNGFNNIALGFGAGSQITGNYNIDIGNPGAGSDNGVIRIGTPGIQTGTYLAGNVGINAGLNIDQTGTYGINNGSVSSSALTFGNGPGGSGEGIASQRTSGPNQFDLALYTGFNPRLTVMASGNVGIGTNNPGALLEVNGNTVIDNNLTAATINSLGSISGGSFFTLGPIWGGYVSCAGIGSSGSISATSVSSSGPMSCCSITITGGCDLAEPFAISPAEQPVTEGEVVVIDEAHPGQLKLTDQPYDTRVAGVVSGANGINPGIQMHQQGLLDGGKNVALTGRVYVQADTSNGAIKPGDLLTTSGTPGRAMRVSDHLRAQGAILGKAMTALPDGRGLVLVLVTLQ